MTSIPPEERAILSKVTSIDDVLLAQKGFATITSLKLEDPRLSVAFIISNFIYLCDVLGITLNEAQKDDCITEVGQVGWLTMADFKLFLDRMKKHKFYHRDYQELLQEFWKYADERLERAFEIEAGKVDNVDILPRSGEIQRLNQIEVMKIKAQRDEQL